MSPLFTVAIPTRNRARLARLAASYVLSQDFTDIELLLLDNSDTSDLSTQEFKDKRCSVLASTSVLSMRDNWERILDFARGDFVLVLSDKDMLLPGALMRIAELARQPATEMITFRKACYGHEKRFVSTIQRCSGKISLRASSEVLHAWFNEVQHYHDAPMIYNSAVRRQVLLDLRKQSGKFFIGTSPDIGSGAVLMAKLKSYHLVDRPLVMSWYGDWSIGMAASRGARDAAAAAIAEYKNNPIQDAGLVTGVAGSVAETLLACKAAFPALFASYELRWSSYVKSVRRELYRRQSIGLKVDDDLKVLATTRGKRYSWLSGMTGALRFHWERLDLARRVRGRVQGWSNGSSREHSVAADELSDRSPAIVPADVVRAEVQSYFSVAPPERASFRDVPSFILAPSIDFDSAYQIAHEINVYLDHRPDAAA